MNKEIMTLSVDTGSVLINIEDKGDIIGQFRFNPADIDIAKRYKKVIDSMNKIEISENSSDEEIFKATDEIKNQFDYLLNYNVSGEIFKKANPLTPTANGDFYCENVLDGIREIIEKTTEERLEKKVAKINKATKKYHK